MKVHEFKIGNPCGPCEWHLTTGVRIFAWFDFIFQSVFVIPVILQFKIHLNQDFLRSSNETECDPEKASLAIHYSVSDVLNLGLGILSDIFLYIGTKQNVSCITISYLSTWFFIFTGLVRQVLHVSGIVFHVLRCTAETYPYEFVVRLLSQYLIYGIWISLEYLIWLNKGCQFVPMRGLMEPPVDIIITGRPTLITITLSEDTSQAVVSETISGGDLLPEVEADKHLLHNMTVEADKQKEEGREKKLVRKKRKGSSKRKLTPAAGANKEPGAPH